MASIYYWSSACQQVSNGSAEWKMSIDRYTQGCVAGKDIVVPLWAREVAMYQRLGGGCPAFFDVQGGK